MWQFADPIFFAICRYAICGPKFFADVSFSLSYGGKFSDFQFVDCSPKKFAGLQFAVQSKEIWGFEIFGLKYLRNLRIFDCELSPRICGFEVSTTPAVNLPPVSTAPVVHLELWIFPQNFLKIQNRPNGILKGLGETDSWKKPEIEHLVALSL